MNLNKIKKLFEKIDNLNNEEIGTVIENCDLYVRPEDQKVFMEALHVMFTLGKLIDSGFVTNVPPGITGKSFIESQSRELLKSMFDKKYYNEQIVLMEKRTGYDGPLHIKENLSKLNRNQLKDIILLINNAHYNYNLFLSGSNNDDFHYYLNQEAVKRDKSIADFNDGLISSNSKDILKTLDVLPAEVFRNAIIEYCDLDLVWLDNMIEAYIAGGVEGAKNQVQLSLSVFNQLKNTRLTLLR